MGAVTLNVREGLARGLSPTWDIRRRTGGAWPFFHPAVFDASSLNP